MDTIEAHLRLRVVAQAQTGTDVGWHSTGSDSSSNHSLSQYRPNGMHAVCMMYRVRNVQVLCF